GGAVAAAVLVVLLLRRRGELRPRGAAAAGAVLGAAVVATLVIRSGDVADFARFLGVEQRDRNSQIESYSQRTVLTYIGGRIALDHPLTGTGWQGSSESASFRPYLADARTRFPDVAREALPSETRRWGVQNAYVQAAADMGVAGLAALVAVLSAAAWLGVRGWLRGADGAALGAAGIVVVVAAELAALALVPGVPVWALLWLAAGVAVASPAVSREPA
ncbi:MAG TPA: O-antigen ligase family protein, partial [Gaiellaceae bacterium]|nr:O-antigen ligase family protein [Gaiellaceae bacterium]